MLEKLAFLGYHAYTIDDADNILPIIRIRDIHEMNASSEIGFLSLDEFVYMARYMVELTGTKPYNERLLGITNNLNEILWLDEDTIEDQLDLMDMAGESFESVSSEFAPWLTYYETVLGHSIKGRFDT